MPLQFSIDDLRAHAEATQKDASDLKVTLAAIDAYQRVSESGALDPDALHTIKLAAFHKHRGPMFIGTELLVELSVHSDSARQIWREMACSSHAHERRTAVASMGDFRVSRSLALDVIGMVINDRSTQVLRFAAQSARSRKLVELRTSLAAATMLDTLAKRK